MDERFYFPSKEWADMGNLKFEEVNLKSDTVNLHGIFLKPEKKPKATVFFFHGAGGNVSRYTFMTKPLVDAGYQVFMIDFRGYGKSTGKPTHVNIATDAQLVFDYLIARPDVQKTKMILYGASMGSQAAAKIARDNQPKVHALILDGGISSMPDMALEKAPASQHDMIRNSFKVPYSAKEDVKMLKNIPVLVIHSKTDQEVGYAQGKTLFASANEPKQFLEYEGKHLEAMKTEPAKVVAAIDKLIGKKGL